MPRGERRTSGRRGFTLLEALVVIALMALLAGSAPVQLSTLLDGMRLAGAARTLATALRLARGRAIARNTSVEVRFDSGRGTWDARQPDGVTLEARTLPPGVAFGSLPARGRILFGALGTAENGTVTLVAGPRARRVVVNQRGRVRVQ